MPTSNRLLSSWYNRRMQILGDLVRALIGVPLFLYVPGFVLSRLLPPGGDVLHGIEQHVARVVVSLLVTGWLALILAEVGWFSLWLLVALVAGFSLVVMLRVRRRTSRPPKIKPMLPARRSYQRFDLGLLAIALLFGVLVARPFEVIRGGLDAGVYANTGALIARTGSIVIHDPIVEDIGQRAAAGDSEAAQIASNVLGVQDRTRNLSTRVRAAGFFIQSGELATGRVVPQFFHLWPTWIAIFVAMLGPALGLIATGVMGTIGVMLLGLIGRRIAGAPAGLLAAAFLATMTPQVWFSRMPTSEALTQALLLAGIWAVMHFADATVRPYRIWWGAIAGAAFGELALTRIDSPLAISPLLALLVYVAVTHRWHAGYWAMLGTLVIGLIHALLHTVLIARGYFVDTMIPTLQKYAITIWLSWPLLSQDIREYSLVRKPSRVGDIPRLLAELGVVVALVLGLLGLWRWPRPLLVLESRLRRWHRPLLAGCALLLGLMATYGYLIRPGILSADVLRDPLSPANWLRLQGYVGAPIAVPFERFPGKEVQALALATMVRLGWYLSPLGVLLGTIGGMLVWLRLNRRTWLLACIATVYTVFFVGSVYGTREQTFIYILRRYVPIVYPAFALGIALALAELKGGTAFRAGSRWNRLRFGLFGLSAAAMLLFFVWTGRPVYAHTEYGGALAQVGAISALIGERDVVLTRGGGANYVAVSNTPELVAAPLTYIYGRNVLPVRGRAPAKYPAAFAGQVTRWRAEGRHVFLLLAASGGDMLFPGYVPKPVKEMMLQVREFQQLQSQKPKLSYINEVPFQLYELVPDAPAPTSLSYDDTAAQVIGFYRSELTRPDEPRASWTDGGGVIRLPAAAQGQRLLLNVAGGRRPQAIGPAEVCLYVAPEPALYLEGDIRDTATWQRLDCTVAGRGSSSRSRRVCLCLIRQRRCCCGCNRRPGFRLRSRPTLARLPRPINDH